MGGAGCSFRGNPFFNILVVDRHRQPAHLKGLYVDLTQHEAIPLRAAPSSITVCPAHYDRAQCVCSLARADYHHQHAARSELPGDPAPAPRPQRPRCEPSATPEPRLQHCSQGNTYNTPGGTNSSDGSSYHYSNNNGSYYYANDNGSTYYQPPPSSSAPPVYTPPPSK